MKRTVIVLLLAGGCGGGGGGGSSPPPPAPQPPARPEPVTVNITRTASGCLLSDNADAEVNYQLGAGQARTLLWSCANINARTRVGVEAFYTFDAMQGCFVERSVIFKAGDCSARATAPATPTLTASIRTISAPSLVFIGSGTYALNLDAEVTITGNLTAFKPTIQVSSAPSHFAALDSIGNTPLSGALYIQSITAACLNDPSSFQACSGQRATHVFQPIQSTSTTSGQHYTFTMTVLDFFGNSIGSTSFSLTAP